MTLRPILLACAAALLPAVASAQAVAAKYVNLRAGPDRDYPLVASYGPGAPLAVQGCIDGFTWCDVVGPDGSRGWIYGGNIAYPYESRTVPVYGYGANIGIPIVTFALGAYWGSYYGGRPWYRDRGRWEHHRPPPRPPIGRPPPRPFPGPIGAGPGGHRPPPGVRPPGDHRPPPGGRPPGGNRPPIGQPGGGRPPQVGQPGGGHRPPDGRPGGGRPSEGRPPSPRPGGEGRPQHGGGGGGGRGEQNRRQ